MKLFGLIAAAPPSRGAPAVTLARSGRATDPHNSLLATGGLAFGLAQLAALRVHQVGPAAPLALDGLAAVDVDGVGATY